MGRDGSYNHGVNMALLLEAPTVPKRDEKPADAAASTKSVRIAVDLVAKLKLIEAAHEARGEAFNMPSYLSGLLRKKIVEEYDRARQFFADNG